MTILNEGKERKIGRELKREIEEKRKRGREKRRDKEERERSREREKKRARKKERTPTIQWRVDNAAEWSLKLNPIQNNRREESKYWIDKWISFKPSTKFSVSLLWLFYRQIFTVKIRCLLNIKE